jgi:FkbM family methyltransferase
MRLRFDLVELVAIVSFSLLALTVVGVPARVTVLGPALVDDDVLAQAVQRYGSEKYSQGPEEWLIREFFKDRRDGVFLDVGSYDARKWSNTYRLEHDFGWSGVAIDAVQEFADGYRQFRPRTRFVVAFVGDRDTGTETLHVNLRDFATSSVDDSFTHRFTDKTVAREVPVRTLDAIVDEAQVTRIDLLSMDIELGEPVALSHFAIARHRPQLAVVEAHGQTRQAILDYFARANYVVVGRYLRADTQNLYFTPLDVTPRPASVPDPR